MVILGGMANIRGVVIGGFLIMFFDRVILAQSTMLVRNIGKMLNNPALAMVDLSLWRWFFFGLTLIVVMVLRPEGLFPSKARRAELLGVEIEEGAPVVPEDELGEAVQEVA
jgi:branched-chain amino acid transport system permease protein